jgi:hypothetical protein
VSKFKVYFRQIREGYCYVHADDEYDAGCRIRQQPPTDGMLDIEDTEIEVVAIEEVQSE